MATKKTIAIIGASGNMGSAIAKSLAKSPYRLLLFGKEEAKLPTDQQMQKLLTVLQMPVGKPI